MNVCVSPCSKPQRTHYIKNNPINLQNTQICFGRPPSCSAAQTCGGVTKGRQHVSWERQTIIWQREICRDDDSDDDDDDDDDDDGGDGANE